MDAVRRGVGRRVEDALVVGWLAGLMVCQRRKEMWCLEVDMFARCEVMRVQIAS